MLYLRWCMQLNTWGDEEIDIRSQFVFAVLVLCGTDQNCRIQDCFFNVLVLIIIMDAHSGAVYDNVVPRWWQGIIAQCLLPQTNSSHGRTAVTGILPSQLMGWRYFMKRLCSLHLFVQPSKAHQDHIAFRFQARSSQWRMIVWIYSVF